MVRTRKKSLDSAARAGTLRWSQVNGKLDLILQRQETFNARLEEINKAFNVHTSEDSAYQKHMGMVLSGDPEDEDKIGLTGRIKSLEQTEKRREKHIWFVYSTLTALVLARLTEWFKWLSVPAR